MNKETRKFRVRWRHDENRTRWNDRIISSRKHRKDGYGARTGAGEDISIRIKRVPFFPRPENDLPARSARPTGLRGHAGTGDVIRIRECYSEADVRISPSKVSCPLLQRYINFSLVILRVPPPPPPPPPPISGETLPPRRSICIQTTPDLVLHFARPDCASLSTLISAPFISPHWEWKK